MHFWGLGKKNQTQPPNPKTSGVLQYRQLCKESQSTANFCIMGHLHVHITVGSRCARQLREESPLWIYLTVEYDDISWIGQQ